MINLKLSVPLIVRHFTYTAIQIVLISFLPGGVSADGNGATPDTVKPATGAGIDAQIDFTEKLVTQSVGAKQVLSSGNQEALQLHQSALDSLEQAKDAQRAGNEPAARAALSKARLSIFKAIKLSGNGVVHDKHNGDFKRRYESVTSLLDAHHRVSEEKKIGQSAVETEQFVKTNMLEAMAFFDKGEIAKAEEALDKAYLTVKLALTKLRSGDTMVRTLNFANKEEEYQYEIDRNNTHKMLVDILLKEKMSDKRLALIINQSMQVAEELRATAEKQASDKDFEAAIESLEKSTAQIVRAIRASGIYIPG